MTRAVKCLTVGCANEGVTIEIETTPGTLVVCGVCSEPIKDVANNYADGDVEVPPWLI